MVHTRILMAFLALVSISGCSNNPNESSAREGLTGRIIITGSSTVAPLVGEIAQRFESLHPGVRIDVQTGGSSRGMADVRRGIANIGMVSRALKPEENDLNSRTIALDGIGVILHAGNPVSELSHTEVVDIYTGRVTNWRDLGGNNAPITVVNKADGRSTLELFLEHFELTSSDIRASVVIGDNQHGILTVAGNPNAIGYVSIGAAIFEAQRGVSIKLIAFGGEFATLENIRNGAFPISRPLNLVTQGDVSSLTEAFIEFASSREIYDLVEAQFFVPAHE